MRSVILIHGLLRGMGREAPCEMLAMKETAGSGPAVYSRCSVIDAPPELPDGLYAVTFDCGVVAARKDAGLWLPNGTAMALRVEEGTGGEAIAREQTESAKEIPQDRRNNVA